MITNHLHVVRRDTFMRFGVPLLATILLFAVAVSSADAAGPGPLWNDKPVVAYAQLAPLSRVQRDLEFLSEGAGQQATTAIRDILGELTTGVDAARPAGMAVFVDETFIPTIFVPLKDEERLFAALHSRFGWEFSRGDDGLYRGLTVKAVARVSGSWLFVTGPSHRERLATLPADPSELFAESDPGILAQVNVAADRIPAELRGGFADFIGGLFDGDDQEHGVVAAIVVHALRHVVTESQSWQVELQCFRPLEQFHITTRITPVAGSELASWIAAAERRPALMEHLATADSPVSFVISAGLEAESLELVTREWQALDAAARAKLPSARSNNVLERRVAQLGTTALDAVSAALANGEFDAGLVVQKQGNETVFLAGSTLAGSRKIDEAAVSVFEMLRQVPDFQALKWATGAKGDVTLHEFQMPADEKTRDWFGEAVHLAAGFGPDRVYAAAGGASTMEKLSQAIDRSREDDPARGGIMHVVLRMAPFLALLDRAQGSNETANANVHEYAELILPHRKNDVLEFNLTAAKGGLEGRLRIDLGVVRMLASSIPRRGQPSKPETASPTSTPAAGATNLTLRSAPNARFQLQFTTDSNVTTTADDAERVDRGRQSSIYDFLVVESRADGAVRLEARLTRATIKKTGPDGDSVFDTADKNEPEKMTPEMVLYAAMIDESFQMTVTADGMIEFSGLAEAVDRMVDNKLQPPANERAQAKAFVERAFNAGALRDTLGRAFEFYPGKAVAEGDRWTRTVENFSGIDFLLDGKYQLKSLTTDEAVISVRSQVREKETEATAPVRWEVLGTQTGTIKVDPRDGRLLTAEYELKLDAEATIQADGKTVVRPVVSTIQMTIAPLSNAGDRAAVGKGTERVASAVEVGDKVRVIREAEIKVGNDVVGTVSVGQELQIEAINGDWVWVNPGKPGWLELRNVAPVGQDTTLLDDINRVVRRYSNQQIVALNPGEEYQFALAGGSKRTIRLVSVEEHRDSVIGFLRRADIRVEIDGRPVNLVCAPYVMPTEIAGLRLQADTMNGWTDMPKRVQFSIWDARDPIVDTSRFRFPIRNFRLLSHGMQAFNEPVHLGLGDGDPQGLKFYHNYGVDMAGFDGGEEIVSATEGEVVRFWSSGNDVCSVSIRDASGYLWGYVHLSSFSPEIVLGAHVTLGQKLGVLGKTGPSGNFSHLHFGSYIANGDPATNSPGRNEKLNLYPWLVTAYQAERPQEPLAVARPHHMVLTGEKELFDGSNSLAFGDRKIVDWRWVFHDGQTVHAAKTERSFDRPGAYVASLWVKDDKGAEDVDFCQVKVYSRQRRENAMPHIFMTHTPTEGIRPDRPVRFKFWFQGKGDAAITVDFGDGTRTTDYRSYTEIAHRFKTAGIHIVTAQCESAGMPITQKMKVVVEAESPPVKLSPEQALGELKKAGGMLVHYDDRLPGTPVVMIDATNLLQFQDEWTRYFAFLPSLRTVSLSGTPLTDAGLDGLAEVGSLQDLILTETKITDAGLAKLAKCKNLKTLNVEGTGVTEAGVAALRKALPQLEVNGKSKPIGTDNVRLDGRPVVSFADKTRRNPTAESDNEVVKQFTAAEIKQWRRKLNELSQLPQATPNGWSKSRIDPARLLTVFPEFHIREGFVLRAYVFKENANSNGFVWALPIDAEFPEPDDCPRLESHFLKPPKPFDALDDMMEVIVGDDSPESYLHAAILRRELKEFGGGWHGIVWGMNTVLDDSPWNPPPPNEEDGGPMYPESKPAEWKWIAAKPESWKPEVRLGKDKAIVTFYSYTPLTAELDNGEAEKERIIRHTETYRRGNYRPLVVEKKLAEGPHAVAH